MDFLDSIIDFFTSSDIPDTDIPDTDVPDTEAPDDNTYLDCGIGDLSSNDLGDVLTSEDYEYTEHLSNYSNVSFMQDPPNANSDGYIPDGNITLERTVSEKEDTFKVYRKDDHLFVHEDGQYKRVDGSGTVNIHNIKYDKK